MMVRTLNLLLLLIGMQSSADIVSGPMLGYVTQREVAVWVQVSGNAAVEIEYWPAAEPSIRERVTATPGEYGVAKVLLSNLAPGTRYDYALSLDGAAMDFAANTFTTQPLWQWRTDPPDFVFAIGSCNFVNEPPFDRPGNPYGGGYEIFESIRAQAPNFMVWLGDNVYFREVDWDSRNQLAHRYTHDRAIAPIQPLLAATHHYATWDDHDYGPNDSDRSYALKQDALELFRLFWANPSYGVGGDGVFGHFTWGDADFFLLDNRFFRAPNATPEGPDKVMWGERQYQWLIDALTSSKATFKFVVNGGQVLNEMAVFDNVSTYQTVHERLLRDLAERPIDGVVFLSGDRHHTELIRLDRPTYPLYDFTSSPLTSGAYDPVAEHANPDRIAGTLVSERNFGLVRVSGPRLDRTLTLETYDTSGEQLWSHTLRAADLATP